MLLMRKRTARDFNNEHFTCIEAKDFIKKFTKYLQRKQDENLPNDVITDLKEIIKDVFGKDQTKVYLEEDSRYGYENWRYDLFNEQEPSDRIKEYEDNNGNIKKYKVRFDGTFDEYMKNNKYERVAHTEDAKVLRDIDSICNIYKHIVIQVGGDFLIV